MKRYKLIFCLTSLAILLIFIAVITPYITAPILAGRQDPVEVISKREIESRTVGDNVSTLYECTVKIFGMERTIRVVKFDKKR